jgi:hypothetical protein
MQKFIVIGGMYRSGTTLTETIIGSHPDISIPPRDFHFLKYYEESKNLRKVYNILERVQKGHSTARRRVISLIMTMRIMLSLVSGRNS